MKVRTRIIVMVVAVYIIGMVTTFYGLNNIHKMSENSIARAELQTASREATDVLVAHLNWKVDLMTSVLEQTEFTGSYDPNTCAFGTWLNSDSMLNNADEEIRAKISEIVEPHNFIHEKARVINDLVEAGDIGEAHRMLNIEVIPSAAKTVEALNEISNMYAAKVVTSLKYAQQLEYTSKQVIIIGSIIGFLAGVALCVVVIHGIMVPLRKITKMANMISDGNLQSNYSYTIDDEIGALSKGLNTIQNTVKAIMGDMAEMARIHSDGDIDYFINATEYEGAYKDVVEEVNCAIKNYVDDNNEVLNGMKEYADGNFEFILEQRPGKKAVANEVMESVRNNLSSVKTDTMILVQAAIEGNLEKRIDVSHFSGDWADIIGGMNELLQTIALPLEETSATLAEMSKGNLTAKVNGIYSGKFAEVKNSLNLTVSTVASYIDEINEILGKMSDGDLTVGIDREYVGQFDSIKESINAIASNLNRTIADIGAAADQLLVGANQISESSMNLAEGASRQAVSVGDVTSSADVVNAQIQENAENSSQADILSQRSMENSKQGNAEMELMLGAMESIESASNNISNIIRVIEDISSQTNLLAINAAVEAARAGVHGKGFSVVAEEVRSLAVKSKDAAQETTKLIEDSIESVQNGISIAKATSEALNTIMEDVNSVSDIISKISESSVEQADRIVHMSEGLGRVSDVINANSATSEESAAAAEELNSQAIMLKKMVEFFKVN